MDTPRRTRTYRSHHLDSERWDHVTLRPGDVVISTSMKAGTTWMQRIMSLLVFGAGPLPAPLVALSPWIDSAFLGDVDGVVATIEAQEHQRFLKSHLPFDALPYDPAVRYVYVGRDTRDVFMSAFNHYSGYTELTYSLLDAAGGAAGPMPRCPATERELWADWMTRSLFDWETDGWPFWSHHHHAASFWPYRDLPNVLMVHYADLLADLEAQMRRVAAFTQLEVAEDAWPELVAAARFDAMKQEAIRNEEYIGLIFEGGAGRFFHKGTNGRWRDVLTERTWPSTRQQPLSSTRSCAHGSKPMQRQGLTPAFDAAVARKERHDRQLSFIDRSSGPGSMIAICATAVAVVGPLLVVALLGGFRRSISQCTSWVSGCRHSRSRYSKPGSSTIGIGSGDAGATAPTAILASMGMNGDSAGRIGAVTISTGSP